MKEIFPAVISLLAVVISIFVYKQSVNKDKHQLILEFGKELEKTNPNKLVVEHLFASIYSTNGIKYNEILKLVSLHSPLEIINDFKYGRRYSKLFEINDNNGEIFITLRSGLSKLGLFYRYGAGILFSTIFYTASIYLVVDFIKNIAFLIDSELMNSSSELLTGYIFIFIIKLLGIALLSFTAGISILITLTYLRAMERIGRMNRNLRNGN